MIAPIHRFEPITSIHPSVAGLYPFTFNGTLANSGERLQQVANGIGMTILATELMGQSGRPIFNLSPRQALKPGDRFVAACARTAEALKTPLQEFNSVVGIGHSLGGVMISGLHNYAESGTELFSAIQLCDTFNLRAPQGHISGYSYFGGYQLVDGLQRSIHKRALVPYETQIVGQEMIDEPKLSVARNIHNLSPLMRSTESRTSALALAGDKHLPLHVIGFTRGLSGSATQVRQFLAKIEHSRRTIAEHTPDIAAAPIRTDYVAGWHSDLTNADKVITNLKLTLELLTQPT